MEWKDLSYNTLIWMKELGDYSPTTRRDFVKGYIGEDQEGQSYLDSEDLRGMAKAFNEVADFLDSAKQEDSLEN